MVSLFFSAPSMASIFIDATWVKWGYQLPTIAQWAP